MHRLTVGDKRVLTLAQKEVVQPRLAAGVNGDAEALGIVWRERASDVNLGCCFLDIARILASYVMRQGQQR